MLNYCSLSYCFVLRNNKCQLAFNHITALGFTREGNKNSGDTDEDPPFVFCSFPVYALTEPKFGLSSFGI